MNFVSRYSHSRNPGLEDSARMCVVIFPPSTHALRWITHVKASNQYIDQDRHDAGTPGQQPVPGTGRKFDLSPRVLVELHPGQLIHGNLHFFLKSAATDGTF